MQNMTQKPKSWLYFWVKYLNFKQVYDFFFHSRIVSEMDLKGFKELAKGIIPL